ncbi:MAG: hypothetical protein PHS57_06880 [Alphaproteobacteria bacterium]|nr:hypothetical protein [Alphaproteobacteria bacterium]
MTTMHKILVGVLGAAAFVVVVSFFCLSLANARLRVQVADLQGRAEVCLSANEAFARQAAQQNKAIAAMKTDAATRRERARQAAEAARKRARTFFEAAARLRTANPPGDACRAADALLTMYLEDAL